MEPVPGYAAASWDRGYGDFALKPDLATLHRVPWLEGTALVLATCWITTTNRCRIRRERSCDASSTGSPR
jgi:glutamine synthetase